LDELLVLEVLKGSPPPQSQGSVEESPGVTRLFGQQRPRLSGQVVELVDIELDGTPIEHVGGSVGDQKSRFATPFRLQLITEMADMDS
jgi:hypothetical protein